LIAYYSQGRGPPLSAQIDLTKTMTDRQYGIETLCLHAGAQPDAATGARALPIHQTTSFVFDSAEHAASLFNLQTFGNVYSRIGNPTVAAFEERMAALEGGRAAVAAATGLAAQIVALLTLCQAGDRIVAARSLYGGSFSQLDVSLRKLGIETVFVDSDDPENFRAALSDNTRCIFAETVANPRLNVLDIAAVAKVAHDHRVPLIIDNTVPSPYLCRPFEHGADIVVHSATKFLGGHGTTLGGVVIESGKFDWGNGKFPGMTEPSAGYHGVKFYETFGDFGFTMKARMETLRTFGPALSPFSAWQLMQGIETLPLRMQRHCENALAVARHLQKHPRVAWVNYPGLPESPGHALAQRYLGSARHPGAGALLCFGVKGGQEAGERFIDALQFCSHLANIGDAKTLVIHPASTTHRQLGEADQQASGVTPDLVRLSVGLETIDDILWDLDQALERAA
jgi:O-acetylhomoserine (thiol)-lyase